MKLAIIYYSQTGHNYQMAKWAKEEAEKNGAEVRLVRVKEFLDESAAEENPAWKKYLEESKEIKEATSDDLIWADAIIFSAPTRFAIGSYPGQAGAGKRIVSPGSKIAVKVAERASVAPIVTNISFSGL